MDFSIHRTDFVQKTKLTPKVKSVFLPGIYTLCIQTVSHVRRRRRQMDNTGFLPNSAWGFSKILSSEKEMQLKTALLWEDLIYQAANY